MNPSETTKHELVNDDTVFVGSATEIIEQMRQQSASTVAAPGNQSH